MTTSRWTAWPTAEALSRVGVPRGRMVLDGSLLTGLCAWVLIGAYLSGAFGGWAAVVPPLALALCAAAAVAYHFTTLANQLARSIGCLAVVSLCGLGACAAGAGVAATVLWITTCVMAVERLPGLAGLGVVSALAGGFYGTDETGLLGAGITTVTVLLAGYSLRLDAQARGAGFRLLTQERAARAAEAESAALAERARIAREIHDVLAHSLSAQLVHLEAARLQIERGAEREQVLERVVAARSMARQGLAETRQALSALRGDLVPVEDFLHECAGAEDARLEITGPRRPLPAEASQAVRRVAQEALTNVRKHAPGARTRLLLAYGEGEVALEVRDSGAADGGGELAASGSGYGLRGMRERAELLGGSLEAGPDGEGFVVRLRVPA
ncbi:histidine kinase [Streptomyces sp. NPDC001941]|uniref:sensor histidine kinase n=1 Tax=Streptomyces sp. NPDC001941 TaxID=3154659 RepID=UPI00331B1B53